MNRFEKIRKNQQMVLMLARSLPQQSYAQLVQAIKATESILKVLEALIQTGDSSGQKQTIIAELEAQLDEANSKLETTIAELEKAKSPKKRRTRSTAKTEETEGEEE